MQQKNRAPPRPEGNTFLKRVWDNLYARPKHDEQAVLVTDVKQRLAQGSSYKQLFARLKNLLGAVEAQSACGRIAEKMKNGPIKRKKKASGVWSVGVFKLHLKERIFEDTNKYRIDCSTIGSFADGSAGLDVARRRNWCGLRLIRLSLRLS